MIGKISGMEDVIEAIGRGADFYLVLGSLMFDKEYEQVTTEERTEAKQGFWKLVYSKRLSNDNYHC